MNDQQIAKQEVHKFLSENFIMNLAFCRTNKPSASVLLYYIDDKFNFYFATHTSSYKTSTLLENPLVSLTVWKHNQMMIQVDGAAKEISHPLEKDKIIDNLTTTAAMEENFWPPIARISGTDYTVFKITPNWMRKLDLMRSTINQPESPFTIISLV